MTKRDYETLAGVFRAFDNNDTKLAIIHALAIRLEAENSRFDTSKFLAACTKKGD